MNKKEKLIFEIINYFMHEYSKFDPEEMMIEAMSEYIWVDGYEEIKVGDLFEMDSETIIVIHKRFFNTTNCFETACLN